MSAFRKLKALALGQNTDMDLTSVQLQAADVPVTDAPCRGCADPCDEGHDEYPKFDVDLETQMLGSVKPYARQIVISTGKSDWVREVTDAKGTLAAYVDEISSSGRPPKDKDPSKKSKDGGGAPAVHSAHVPGIFDSSNLAKNKRVTILNGSHRTVSTDHDRDTVLVFPDYRVVTEVARTHDGADQLWTHAVSPSLALYEVPPGSTAVKSWIIPYSCVILLCSHKRRDNRCAIAAPKLEHALTLALERQGWEVHTQVDDSTLHEPALEDLAGTAAEKHAALRAQLQGVDAAHADHKRALVLFCSHIGGHKYAGNVIINTPRGVSVWYGRVTPHEVDAIVRETIIGGRILPSLLRGGMNLCHPGRKTLNDW
ncbi:Sucrase/ferredoxin-like-domain-containing protein [Trametes gibbosa]|nr:Sucrase/ferredoxin-like-domain-containing protein [Trametes gibbosa]